MTLSMAQSDLLSLLLRDGVLCFGQFKTKSGRVSPYFFNSAKLSNGCGISLLAHSFAALIEDKFKDSYDALYGPAYKGIPLAATTAMAMYQLHGRSLSYTFNRKEAKGHGEGGVFVGQDLQSEAKRLVIVEDVLTAGTSLRESLMLIKGTKSKIVGVVVAIDRQERGQHSQQSALDELRDEFQLPIYSLLNLDQILSTLRNKVFAGKIWIDDATAGLIDSYRRTYGAMLP
jgi:orotate phosphoribosyltransferase